MINLSIIISLMLIIFFAFTNKTLFMLPEVPIISKPHSKKFDYIFIIFLVTTAIYTIIVSTIGLDIHHDGVMLKPALDVTNGAFLFRDSFNQYGALATLIHAIFIKIFGELLLVIKVTTALFYSLSMIMIYKISNHFLRSKESLLVCILWFLLSPFHLNWAFSPWSSVFSLFFQLLGTLFFINFLEKRKKIFTISLCINDIFIIWRKVACWNTNACCNKPLLSFFSNVKKN